MYNFYKYAWINLPFHSPQHHLDDLVCTGTAVAVGKPLPRQDLPACIHVLSGMSCRVSFNGHIISKSCEIIYMASNSKLKTSTCASTRAQQQSSWNNPRLDRSLQPGKALVKTSPSPGWNLDPWPAIMSA